MLLRASVLFVLLAVTGCDSAGFSGGSGAAAKTTKPVEQQAPAQAPARDEQPPAALSPSDPPGPFAIRPVPDAKVEVWPYQDVTLEPLALTLAVDHGEQPIAYVATVDIGKVTVNAGKLVYLPTTTDASGVFADNAGDHTIHVTATDGAGKTATAQIKVSVLETSVTSTEKAENDGSTDTDGQVVSPLHPNWQLQVKDLTAQNCHPMIAAADGDVQMLQALGPVTVNAPQSVAAGTLYEYLDPPMDIPQGNYQRVLAYTWEHLIVDDPNGIVKHFESTFPSMTCLGPTGETPDVCTKNALAANGIHAQWYCSDYVDTIDYGPGLAATMKGLACGSFPEEGVATPPECAGQ